MERLLNIYGDFEVTQRKSGDYEVNTTEGNTFIVKKEKVKFISEKCDTDPLWIAFLLSQMEATRRSKVGRCVNKMPDNEVIADTLSILLKEIQIECLTGWMLEAKWHEVMEIFDSQSPLEKFQELN